MLPPKSNGTNERVMDSTGRRWRIVCVPVQTRKGFQDLYRPQREWDKVKKGNVAGNNIFKWSGQV